jgi:Caspase domain
MARLLISAVLALLGVCFVALGDAHAVSERRVALVIGNSEYKNSSLSLSNPKNDAIAIAAVLKSLDFEVQLVTDVGKRDMDGVLERFARLSINADSALFYYAGHAIQYHGKNYLMPVDAELEDEISVRYNLVSVDDARSALDRVSGVKIMILDACRNNPIADRLNREANGGQTRSATTTRGLARIDKTQGMVVAYATAADDVALDGNNVANSPFTAALVKEMQEPGLEIGTMFRRVARDVNDSTGGRQRPETSISLLSEYYLNQSDRKIWEEMRETADIPQILEFLRRYPNSISSLDAKYRLDVLERAKRDREDEEARIRREAYKKELAEQEAAARAEIAKLQEERRRADALAADRDSQRQRDEKAQLAAIEEQRKKDQQAAAERAAQQQRDEQQRLAKLEQDRENAAKALADKHESEQRRQAAEKLAALEQERVKAQQEVAAREEARRKEEEARQKAAAACKSEQTALDDVGRDEAKLKLFTINSTCADAKVRAQSLLASLTADRERAERACDSESKQLSALMKAPGVESRDKLLELQTSLTCTSLAPKVVEAIGRVNVEIKRTLIRNSQAELRRVGCYRGAENGEFNDATKDALKRVNLARGKANDDLVIDDAALSDLKKLEAPVCAPPARTEPEEKPVASRPNRVKAASRPNQSVRDERPSQAPTARAESHPSSSSGGGGGSVSVHGLSF